MFPPNKFRGRKYPDLPLPEASFYPPSHLESGGEGSFLYAALNRGMEEGQITRIKWELAHLANQILVADGAEVNETAPIYQSVQKAFQFLDLGLQHLSRDDLGRAGEVLSRIALLRVFQTGYSLGLDLKYRAEAIIRRGPWYRDIRQREEVLDSPFKETIQGLFFKRPLYYDRPGGGNYRPFRDRRELEETGATLNNLDELGRLISNRLGVAPGEISGLATLPLYQPDPSLSAVCLTVLANRLLSGQTVLLPLTVEDWERLVRLLFEPSPEGGFTGVGPRMYEVGYRLFTDNQPELSPTEEEALRWWLDVLINKVEAELGGIGAGGKVDPRFISGFIIRRPVGQ